MYVVIDIYDVKEATTNQKYNLIFLHFWPLSKKSHSFFYKTSKILNFRETALHEGLHFRNKRVMFDEIS